MSSEGTGVFTKENLDTLLKELAKEFKRRNGAAVQAVGYRTAPGIKRTTEDATGV